MEIELNDVERLAWEGLLREQQEAASYLAELKSMIRTDGGRHPRGCARLQAEGDEVHAEQTARAVELASAVCVARGIPAARVAPRFVPGGGESKARLLWPEGSKAPEVEQPLCPVDPEKPTA